ncbi:FAD dependent oxidoreductase [Fibrella aestuarina BUZ 2] [Mycobacterium shimoidei]|uniref:FAD dependent oxidoreductase [Fibrella aestuarina BUZ 2] n=1 Tax=Mycobacterium shimoidei TaxID=29313 RepID=A0A375Z0Y5_MYCSH|nr:NAD(P)/FAD-dependent oxidoreductase [Mycobacterium shimoidei]SRX94843.1 FAD dependent oxidoreductase [Fibrella aestuarina BUZ 2] [Mycobacterium shimoidei]
MSQFDAVVVGSGPNGLAAAVTLAEAGRSVLILEGADTPGGGARSGNVTGDDSIHDICSAIHPLAMASPAFRRWPLADYGLEWIFAPIEVAHALDGDRAAALHRDVDETAAGLERDRAAYADLLNPLVSRGINLFDSILDPFPPRHPLTLANFVRLGIPSIAGFSKRHFTGDMAPALLAGMAAHSFMPLTRMGTSAVALMFAVSAHRTGWPMARGGSQQIADALLAYFGHLGGEIRLGHWVRRPSDVPACRALLLDVSPTQVPGILGDCLSKRHRRRFTNYKYGPGLCKVDYLLDGPIPWRAEECRRAGTVHLGGTLGEVAGGEAAVTHGDHPEKPFVLLAQQSRFDPTRSPNGGETVWTYCHVPNGSGVDMSDAIEKQIERFAPGFTDRVVKKATVTAKEAEAHNPNMCGGVIDGGFHDPLRYVANLAAGLWPYKLPARGAYLCSSFTPPGPGVHGMPGYLAARSALRKELR